MNKKEIKEYTRLNKGFSPDEICGPGIIECLGRYFVPKANVFPATYHKVIVGEAMLLEEFGKYEIAPDLIARPNYKKERDLECVTFISCYEILASESHFYYT